MVRKSFTLTKRNNEWLKNAMATGLFGNESEIIRHLIRDKMLSEANVSSDILEEDTCSNTD